MKRKLVQVLPILAVVALAACSSAPQSQSPIPFNPSAARLMTGDGDVPFLNVDPIRRLCATPGTGARMRCFATMRTDIVPSRIADDVPSGKEICPFFEGYCPMDLQEAYQLPSLTRGNGKTVAIVDAYGYDRAASDLAFFRETMGLKPCDTKSKCLRIVNQQGNSSPLPPEPPPGDEWPGEQSLDLDMVSGICPNCKIILVQADNDYTNNLYAGVATAGLMGAKYIGASWGASPEGPDSPTFHQAGVVITAAAGDNGGGGKYGGGPIQPCTYSYVICVGGTHLVRDHSKRGWNETVWNDWTYDKCDGPCGATGSACSTVIAKPAWQTDQGCKMRSAADVSATASLRAPVIVYNSELGCSPPSDCFWLFGGTSASTQIIVGTFALAENAANQMGGSYLWKHHAGHLNDVTVGNNLDQALGVICASSVTYICTARIGFDGPTGWGTPEGIDAF